MSARLNGRTHFSLGESLLTPEEYVAEAVVKGATALALTDTMRISGMAEFIDACTKKAIKPIIGARLRIVGELTHDKASKRTNRPYFLRVLVKNDAGYRALLELLSLAFDKDHFYEVPRLLLSDVCSVMGAAGEGACLVTLGDFYGATAAGKAGEVVTALRAAALPHASEIVPLTTPYFLRQAKEALELFDTEGISAIISMPSLYREDEQADSLDLMRAVCANMKLDERSTRHVWRSFSAKSDAELVDLSDALITALEHRYGPDPKWARGMVDAFTVSEQIADDVTFAWSKEKPSLPIMAGDEFMALFTACQNGWRTRFASPVFGHMPADLEPYKKRLAYELGVLKRLKFEAYFLLVAEIVNWSKSNGIRVGPGRGSVGGSLVAYLMGITDIDPIRFNLLFERFINPDRIDLPDADLDFMGTRCDEVAAWIRGRFGEEHVAGVSNYITVRAAGAMKDVCRMLGIEVTAWAFSKLVPKEHGQPIALSTAIVDVPELEKFAAEHPVVIQHALAIEDRMRAYGKHAAGIVVAGVKLKERAVVETRDGAAVINWDKSRSEDFGLVKIDVLGLSTLDMLDLTISQIKRLWGVTINPQNIPLDDPDVLAAFGRGETVGVFQFESAGMRRLLRDIASIEPLTFEDLTAATALYRPGPMDSGLMEQFVKCKTGEIMPSYPHPSMENALRDTYGVMVYQEEVMGVARDFAGFSLIDADHLRKAMGKKDKVKMGKYRAQFIDGAVALHGADPSFAAEIFDQVEKFAGYGFNKSHASAYAIISYICMWMKVKYPAEFFAGLLTHVKEERRQLAIADMRRLGIELLPPDINISSWVFEPLHMKALVAPLSSVKQVSENAARTILKARESGPFTSVADLVARVEKRYCNSAVRGNLDKVGAFSDIDPTQLPSNHHSRRRDQVELMPGLIDEAINIDRPIDLTPIVVRDLSNLVSEWRACDRCELATLCHPKPWVKKDAKVMLITDGPNFKEESADQIGHGSHMASLDLALDAAGMTRNDVYLTTLIKSPKPEKKKEWSNKTLSECPSWLNREIDIIKPPLIVLLGRLTARHFAGDLKGGLSEHSGRVIYDKTRDMNILLGLSPGSIYFDESKQAILDTVIGKIPGLLPS